MTFERSIPSVLSEIDGLTEGVQAFLAHAVADEDLSFRVALVTSEAVMNALEHGNALDPDRRAHLRIETGPEGGVVVTVTDEGPGFDPDGVPDPLRHDGLLADGGRGVFLMRELSDEVRFTHGGRCVELRLSPRS